jgi:hypothetical protein
MKRKELTCTGRLFFFAFLANIILSLFLLVGLVFKINDSKTALSSENDYICGKHSYTLILYK